MEISKFNDTLLYSNKNVEKLARKLINESANAVLMEMFDDKCVLADHTNGNIYEAKYTFDGTGFTFEDFNQVTLESSNNDLKEAISKYFDDETVNLAEAYEAVSSANTDTIEDSLSEALAGKNMENVIDYTELAGISEEVGDLRSKSIFRQYAERINEKPMQSIKMFDWKHPVKVSLIDEDMEKVLNRSVAAKAKRLRTSSDFKKSFVEAAGELLDGSNALMESLLEENSSIVALDKSDLKELVGFIVVGNKTLMEKRNDIVTEIEKIIGENEILSDKKMTITEGENEDDKDTAPEATEQDVEAIKKALETAKEKATDEKLIKKIEDLIDSLGAAAEAGETDVGAVKESISLLSL